MSSDSGRKQRDKYRKRRDKIKAEKTADPIEKNVNDMMAFNMQLLQQQIMMKMMMKAQKKKEESSDSEDSRERRRRRRKKEATRNGYGRRRSYDEPTDSDYRNPYNQSPYHRRQASEYDPLRSNPHLNQPYDPYSPYDQNRPHDPYRPNDSHRPYDPYGQPHNPNDPFNRFSTQFPARPSDNTLPPIYSTAAQRSAQAQRDSQVATSSPSPQRKLPVIKMENKAVNTTFHNEPFIKDLASKKKLTFKDEIVSVQAGGKVNGAGDDKTKGVIKSPTKSYKLPDRGGIPQGSNPVSLSQIKPLPKQNTLKQPPPAKKILPKKPILKIQSKGKRSYIKCKKIKYMVLMRLYAKYLLIRMQTLSNKKYHSCQEYYRNYTDRITGQATRMLIRQVKTVILQIEKNESKINFSPDNIAAKGDARTSLAVYGISNRHISLS